MKKEIKIGLVVIVSLLMVYLGSTFLEGSNPFKTKREYFAYYKNVNGLNVSNSVRYQGFKVGKVQAISFDAEKNSWLVTFSVDVKTLQLKDSTVAMVASADILGSMIIDLQNIEKGTKVLIPGDTVLSDVEKSIQDAVDERLRPLVIKMESLLGSVDSVINVVSVILDEQTVGHIHGAFEKIPAAINNLLSITNSADSIIGNIEKARIQDLIANLVSISENLKHNNGEVTAILKNFKNISDSLAKADIKKTLEGVNSVVGRVDNIISNVEKGKGSIGLLLNDDKLYNDLSYAAADLDLLLLDLRANPRKYINLSVFGGGSGKKGNPVSRDSTEYSKLFKPMIRELVKEQMDSVKAQVDSTKTVK